MSEQGKNSSPTLKQLGSRLKDMRQKRRESLAEVSGAVEIDVEMLAKVENGHARPAEDILLLLISHFGAKEDEATKLWELAGYDQRSIPAANMVNDTEGNVRQLVMVMTEQTPIIYTDMVHVMANSYGVVINFMQGTGAGNQPLAVARVGMSHEHAKSVLAVLQQTLAQANSSAGPKSLPAPKPEDKNKS